MSTYATVADVQARIPYKTIGAGTTPSTATVQEWLDQAEAKINGTLLAAGLDAPYTSTDAKRILAISVLNFAEGRLRMAYAATGGDGTNQDGKDMVAMFDATILEIRGDPVGWGAMLGAGTAPDAARLLRGHVLDNADGLTVANGDFAPIFETGRENF